jgi:hypothetical protein
VPSIPYSASNFDPDLFPNLQAKGTLTFEWPKLVWAAVTVGKAQEHQAQHGIYSAYERSMRTALVYSSLMESPTGQVVKAPSYATLDPSEKTAVSFYTGMTLVRLFSYSLFGVDWLLHLDLYRNEVQAQVKGKSRPDFLGLNHNDQWLVFESQGCSDYMTGQSMATLMEKAKGQASLLTRVNGAVPFGTIGAVTHFMNDGLLRFDMDDPPPDSQSEEAYQIKITPNALRSDYYRPFVERKNSEVINVGGRRVRATSLGEIEVTVGLDEDVLAGVPMGTRTQVFQREDDREFMGRDGVYVGLGPNWSRENMRRPPTERM